jgi:hypothetical protein
MTNEKTVIIGSNKKPLHLSKEALQKIATKAGIGAAGIVGGIGVSSIFMGMAPKAPETHQDNSYEKPDVSIEPKEITSVNDEMSFGEAFTTARQEAGGANGYFTWHGKVFETIYKEELDKLSPEEKQTMYANVMDKHSNSNYTSSDSQTASNNHNTSPVIVLHDEAPSATQVTNDMSFKDAFAVAREEVGPGGVFEWHGKSYNTYTTEETNAMSAEQKNDFISSIGNATIEDHNIGANDVDIVKIDGGNSTISNTNAEETDIYTEEGEPKIDEQFLEEQYVDDGAGNKIRMAQFLVNGEHVVKVDQDGDGNFDLTMKPNEDGSVHLVSADGQEADLSQEDMANFQQEMGVGQDNNFADDNLNLDTDPNAHLSNSEDY